VAADNATAAQIVDDPALYPSLADASGLSLAGYTYFPPTLGNPYLGYGTYSYAPRNFGMWAPYGAYSPYGVYGFGAYGYGYGYGGFAPGLSFPGRSILPTLPGSRPTYLPNLPIRIPGTSTGLGSGSVYHMPTPSIGTSRPGVMASPSMPRPAAAGAPVVRGGRH